MNEAEVVFKVKNPVNFKVLIGYLVIAGLNLFNLSDSIRDGRITAIEYFIFAVIGLMCIIWITAAVRALIGPRMLQLDSSSVILGRKTLQSSEISEIIIHQNFLGLVNVAILPKGKKIVPAHWSFRVIDKEGTIKALEVWASRNHVDIGWGHFVRWL